MKQGRRKSGNFSDGAKYPDKLNKGLDWQAIRDARAARLDAEIESGKVRIGVEHEVHVMGLSDADAEKLALGEVIKKSTPKPKQPRYVKKRKEVDLDLLVQLYTEGNMKPKDIGLQVGLGVETVIRYLKKREGIYDPNKYRNPENKRGPRPPLRKDKCSAGHDLTLPDSCYEKRKKDGTLSGRRCIKCQANISKKSHKKKVMAEWDQAHEQDLFTAHRYLSYLLIRDHDMTGGEAQDIIREINRNTSGLGGEGLWEKRTKQGWLDSDAHLFLSHLQAERTGTDG